MLSNHSSSNNRTYTKSYSISTASHYNQGKADGKTDYNPTSVTWASRQVSEKYQVYNSSNKNFTKYISVSAKNAAGKTLITNSTYSVTVDGTEAYNAGKNSVSISSAAKLSGTWSPSTTVAIGEADVTYASKVITGGVKVTLSNAVTSNVRVQMNATKAYNAGVTDGTASGKSNVGVNNLTSHAWSSSEGAYTKAVALANANVDYSSKIVRGLVNINLTNDKTIVARVALSAEKAYNEGQTAVYNSIAYSSSGYETDEYGSTDYGNIWVSLSTDKGNKTIGYVPSKYWDGYDAGKGSTSYATFKIVGVNTSTYEVLVSSTTWDSMYWLSIGDTFDQT